ncbi:integrin alpha-3-like [Brachyhypopomus gauderio]|uniref:integrin alpha-3-like n=1 Tax=Brachyhypopomus gauderio TaxID=698409 RepID=UPI0040421335
MKIPRTCPVFSKYLYLLLLLVLCDVSRCLAFNLDVRFPVVKEGQTPGSLFGFSVALHQQVVGENRYLLLVGAPKERAEPSLSANQTGDMFACPISTNPKDCVRANLVSSDPPQADEMVEDMWLGVSVASQGQPGGRVMACGHRYTRIDRDNFHMIGRCYITRNDLTFDPNDLTFDPDEVHTRYINWQEKGMCNMGISGTFTQTEVITGAPGCYNWQGNTFVTYRNPNDMFDIQKTKFPYMNDGNIYMGYSVDKQRGVLSRDEDTVVTGAPRDQSKGSVFLAQSVTKQNRLPELQKQVTLEGEQVGSYFGNCFAVVDINNDGWKDLIVGAPFYFDWIKEEGGAVYVFMNENGSFNSKHDAVFTGPRNSGFGMAVAAIGDVDQDGFQDFAVGVPFHDSGRVYVWMGSKTGISNKHSQVIEGKDITNGGFRTFGYSISGGLDVDRNSYPDIVVGSLDDCVALLRARPVIHLTKTFTVMPPIVDPTDCGDSCIEVKVCFSYTLSTGDSNFRQNITVKFTVDADLLRRSSVSRVRFLSNNKDSYTGYLSMPSEDCQTLKLGVVAPVQDKVTALSFSLNVSLYEPESSSSQQLQSLDAFPVMSQREAPMDRTEIHFQKACGPDNKCESNLQMTAMFAKNQQEIFTDRDGQQVLLYESSIKKLSLLVNVSNTPTAERPAEDAHNALLNITIPPSLRYSGILITPEYSEIVCSFQDTFVLCELGQSFTTNQMVEITVFLETSRALIDIQEIICVLELSTLSTQNDLTPLTKTLMVLYSLQASFQAVPQRVQIEFSGKVVGESAMKATRDIGSPVEFSFMVNVVGKPLEDLGYLQVDFDWPTDVDNGKWLLYLSEIKMTGTSTSVCVPPGNIVNPLNLEVSEHHSERMKREMEGSVESVQSVVQPSLTSQRGQRVSLGCVTGGAQCQTFTCPLHNMTNTATVTVQARLWNSTMLEDYIEALTVEVYGQATLRLITDKPTIRMENQTAKFSVEITPARQYEAVYEVPLWIIIVSTLTGLVLLGLITMLLFKDGLFLGVSIKELEAKVQKAEMRTQPCNKFRLTEED